MSWVPFTSRVPPYPTAVQHVLAYYDDVANHRRGRIVFLSGDTGASRGALDAVRGALTAVRPVPLLLEGDLYGNKYVPRAVVRPPAWSGVIDQWLAIGTRIGGLVNPAGGLIGQLAQTLLALWRIDAIGDAAPDLEAPAALPALMRRAADVQAWKGAGPVVWLIDRLEGAPDWVDIIRHLGRQLAVDVPVLLCFGVDGPLVPPDDPDDHLLLVARRLTSPDVDQATWVPLPPLTLAQVEAWIGPVDSALARRLYEVTQGNHHQTRELWSHWQQRGIVYPSGPGDRWEIAPGEETRTLADVDDLLRERLHELLGADSGLRIDEALHLLGWAAREGRTFTADVLVHILQAHGDKDPDLHDRVVDFLDDTLHATDDHPHPSAVIAEAEPTTVVDPRTGPQTLWRYAFTADLYWRALRHYGINQDEATAARAVAEALVVVYGPAVVQVARTVARLLEEAGDTESARPYHRMATVATSREAVRWRARALGAANRGLDPPGTDLGHLAAPGSRQPDAGGCPSGGDNRCRQSGA